MDGTMQEDLAPTMDIIEKTIKSAVNIADCRCMKRIIKQAKEFSARAQNAEKRAYRTDSRVYRNYLGGRQDGYGVR